MRKTAFYISLAIIINILTFLINLPDYDLWARLAVGSVFFQTGHLLRHDIFSYLPTKILWIDHEWGSGVVFYFLTNFFGDKGIFALKAFIILSIFILFIKIIKLQTDEYTPGIFYFILLGFAMVPGLGAPVRCQVFTYLFFTLWIYELERVKREDYKFIWIFPATMLLWANMHGGFVSGIGLIIIYILGESCNRRNPLKYIGILALVLPVTLINPYGFKLWNYIIDAALMARPYIGEWQPISLSGPFHTIAGIKVHILAGFLIFAFLTLITVFKLLIQKEKPDWTKLILVLLLLYLSFRHQRHAEFFILAVAGLLYPQYVSLFDPVRKFIEKNLNDRNIQIWNESKYWLGYVLLAMIFIYSVPRLSNRLMVDPADYPVGSLEFIKQNNISGNLATQFKWGSYALWKLYPQCKVLIDGRYEEVYPDAIFDTAMQFSEKKGDWSKILREHPTDILVLPKRYYSPADIAGWTDWKYVYQDKSSVVLLTKSKLKPFYFYPDYKNPEYSREDLSKKIKPD